MPALCAGLVALALDRRRGRPRRLGTAPGAAKTKPSAIKKAKKKAVKKTTKAVRAELQSSLRARGSRSPPKAQRSRSRAASSSPSTSASGFKCSWCGEGQLPGLVPFRCAGKAKLKANGRKIKRLDPCNNNLEALAPLLETPHPVAFGYFEDWPLHPDLYDASRPAAPRSRALICPGATLQPNQGTPPANWDWGPSDRIYQSLLAVGRAARVHVHRRPLLGGRRALCRRHQPARRQPPRRLRRRGGPGRAPLPAVGRDRDLARAQRHGLLGRATRSPNTFSDLVKATSSAVRATGSQIPLITGGLAPGEADPNKLVYGDFLAQALQHGGIETADAIGFDAVTSTPFTSPDDPTAGYLGRLRVQLQDLRSRLAAAGQQRPIAITELAYSTTGDNAYTEDQQAAALDSSYGVLRRIPNVSLAIVSRLFDNGDGSKVSGFGVLRPNGSPKTAYCRLAATVGAPKPNGC